MENYSLLRIEAREERVGENSNRPWFMARTTEPPAGGAVGVRGASKQLQFMTALWSVGFSHFIYFSSFFSCTGGTKFPGKVRSAGERKALEYKFHSFLHKWNSLPAALFRASFAVSFTVPFWSQPGLRSSWLVVGVVGKVHILCSARRKRPCYVRGS